MQLVEIVAGQPVTGRDAGQDRDGDKVKITE